MNGIAPSSLPSTALARRLDDLCREERNVQADFLLHLDEYDRRRAYLEAGYGSLRVYCLEALHLRESAAGRRIAAMKVLRRFPALEAPLRDGRVCLSTVSLLGPILSDDNLDELVGRAAFKSKAETERLVVSIQPRVPPRDGVRRLPGSGRVEPAVLAGPNPAAPTVESARAAPAARVPGPADAAAVERAVKGGAEDAAGDRDAVLGASPRPIGSAPVAVTPVAPGIAPVEPPVAGRSAPASRSEVRPISADHYSLRVTIDAACKDELDLLTSVLSHTCRGDLAAGFARRSAAASRSTGSAGVRSSPSASACPGRRADGLRRLRTSRASGETPR